MAMETPINAGNFQEYDYTLEDAECEWKQVTEYWRFNYNWCSNFISYYYIGDYIVALEENRPVDESVITLMKMSVTGLIGVIGGYIGGSK
jgi:hypothetical protein